MTRPLEDKVAVVTGGASGTGRATVLAMSAAGARVAIADITAAITHAVVAAATGVKRKETPALDAEGKPRTNAKGEPITKTSETEQVYVDRALAAKGLTLAQITPDITKAAAAANDGAGLSVDIRAQERKPAAPKKLAQKFLDSVRSLIADGKIDKFKKAYEKLVGQPLAADASEETLGWALKEYTDIKAEQARSQF